MPAGTRQMDAQRSGDFERDAASGAASAPAGYAPIIASDVHELSEQLRDWHFEFTQLTPGKYHGTGAIVQLDGVSIVRATHDQTVLRRGDPPPNMVALVMPGPGSGEAFVHGQLVESGQCLTFAGGGLQEAITHGHYAEVAVGFDLTACDRQLDSLNGGSTGVAPGITIAAPGPSWIADMLSRIEWILAAVLEQPQSKVSNEVRARLADHVLAAMVQFDSAPADVDSTTRAARAGRRVAVRLARDYIHARLSEPVRLSELCRHAHLKIRSLEYGFREVTGLTPVAYIRSLRLNAVRKVLQRVSTRQRSISEIATDTGFWHLSQFALDYRQFFGETPTETRRRSLARGFPASAAG